MKLRGSEKFMSPLSKCTHWTGCQITHECSRPFKDDLWACGGRLMKFCLTPRAVDRVPKTRLADAFSLTALKLAPPRLCAKNRRTAISNSITVSGFGRWSVDSTAPICAGSHQVVVACAWRQGAFVAFSRSCLDGSFVAFSLSLSLSLTLSLFRRAQHSCALSNKFQCIDLTPSVTSPSVCSWPLFGSFRSKPSSQTPISLCLLLEFDFFFHFRLP